jgi:dolichyl-phosphate beta-glucosyltransferase
MLVWTILIAISAALIGFIFHPAWEQKDSDFIENILHNTGSTTSSHKDIILSIIIPAYNEELRIRSMMDETIEYLEVWKSKDSTIERKYEIFIIDDGSTDNTISEVINIQTQYHKVPISLVKLKRNQGKGAAVSHGVLQSNGDYVLMVDADGATDIKDLETLFSTMKQIEKANPDTLNVEGVVIGSR